MWNRLDRYDVPNPCPMSWDKMNGTDSVRRCHQCEQDIYNLAQLSRKEIQGLIAKSEGRICVALTRDAKGRLLTLDAPSTFYGKRLVKLASAALATILSLSPVFGAARAKTDKPQAAQLTKPAATPLVQIEPVRKSKKTEFVGTVTTYDGKPLAGVKVILFAKKGWAIFNTKTRKDGTYRLTGLHPGEYTLEVRFGEGWTIYSTDITFAKGDAKSVDVSLNTRGVVVGTIVVRATPFEIAIQILKAPVRALKKIFR